jgi:predicted nucleotidyltransferase
MEKALKQSEIIQILRDYSRHSGQHYSIKKIGIFGSVAREQSREASDIDVVVELGDQDLFILIGIKQDLEERFKIPVDIVSYRNRMNQFLKDRIDKEAVYV